MRDSFGSGTVVGSQFQTILSGTVDVTTGCITGLTERLNSQGHSYMSRLVIEGYPDYAKPGKTGSATVSVAEISEGKEKQIGTIDLQLIPDERTLFKVSHPKDWDSSFKYFLDALFAEFERLGFVKKEEATVSKERMGNIIGDLRVLSDKCNRDVDRRYPFNYEYYLKELNRILVDLGQIQPKTVEDIGLIEDAKNKSLVLGAVTGEQDAKLREISAVADKLLSRLHQEEEPAAIVEPPRAFIAHGGRSGVLDKLREFIKALGIDPLILELLPTKGMSVDDKVNKYVKDADCGIVLATGGGIIDEKSKKQHPRLNVIDEFERLRTVFPDKTILLRKRGRFTIQHIRINL